MPIRSSVTVSLVPEARGGPFVFWDDLAAACRKAAGARASTPSRSSRLGPTRSTRPSSGRSSTTTAWPSPPSAPARAGSSTGCTLTQPDAAARAEARDFIRSIIDFAGPFGAPAIIGSMQGRSGDGVDQPTAPRATWPTPSKTSASTPSTYGVPLLYEPLNRYETDLVNTVEAGVKLLESLSTRNVILLADLFHMNIEEADIAGALRAGGAARSATSTSSTRTAGRPGSGHLDFAPIAAALARDRLRRLRLGRGAAATPTPTPPPRRPSTPSAATSGRPG